MSPNNARWLTIAIASLLMISSVPLIAAQGGQGGGPCEADCDEWGREQGDEQRAEEADGVEDDAEGHGGQSDQAPQNEQASGEAEDRQEEDASGQEGEASQAGAGGPEAEDTEDEAEGSDAEETEDEGSGASSEQDAETESGSEEETDGSDGAETEETTSSETAPEDGTEPSEDNEDGSQTGSQAAGQRAENRSNGQGGQAAGEARANGSKTTDENETVEEPTVIEAHHLDDLDCSEAGAWHFVINQLADPTLAPLELNLSWSNGTNVTNETVPLDRVTGPVAHYSVNTTVNLTLVHANTTTHAAWDGRFNVGDHPCHDEEADDGEVEDADQAGKEAADAEGQDGDADADADADAADEAEDEGAPSTPASTSQADDGGHDEAGVHGGENGNEPDGVPDERPSHAGEERGRFVYAEAAGGFGNETRREEGLTTANNSTPAHIDPPEHERAQENANDSATPLSTFSVQDATAVTSQPVAILAAALVAGLVAAVAVAGRR